jgi:hypothetical protein
MKTPAGVTNCFCLLRRLFNVYDCVNENQYIQKNTPLHAMFIEKYVSKNEAEKKNLTQNIIIIRQQHSNTAITAIAKKIP